MSGRQRPVWGLVAARGEAAMLQLSVCKRLAWRPAARRLWEYSRDLRLIVLLRDPVERFCSGLTHQLATSRHQLGHRDIQDAFQRGIYGRQVLARALARYGS